MEIKLSNLYYITRNGLNKEQLAAIKRSRNGTRGSHWKPRGGWCQVTLLNPFSKKEKFATKFLDDVLWPLARGEQGRSRTEKLKYPK
ncbi:MAG: hypothetical protein JW891_03550 [Candidatus Lokiarchaeota archaeon]|nr:hypothetical protein [Candidatus Lokiarchaeota archaeon]